MFELPVRLGRGSGLISRLVAYTFLGETMTISAYITFIGIPPSPDTITFMGFRRRCAWRLILAGAGQIFTL